MLSKKIKITFFISLIACLTACFTEPESKTAMGAAAGSVIGAGLGAIVGSQTGDATAGVLIGGAAGAVAGAGVGNYLELDDKKYKSRQERLAKNQEAIDLNRRELDTVKEINGDLGQKIGNPGASSSKSLRASLAKLGIKEEETPEKIKVAKVQPQEFSEDSIKRAEISSVTEKEVAKPKVSKSGLVEKDLVVSSKSANTSNAMSEKLAFQSKDLSAQNSVAQDSTVQKRPSSIFAPVNSKPLEPKIDATQQDAVNKNSKKIETSEQTILDFKENPQAKTAVKEVALHNPIVQDSIVKESLVKNSEIKDLNAEKENTVIEKNAVTVGDTSDRKEVDADVARIMNGEDLNISKSQQQLAKNNINKGEIKSEGIQNNLAQGSITQQESPKAMIKGGTTLANNECGQAEEEMNKAASANDNADKLFHYRRALRLCPSEPAYHNALGELYLKLKRKSDAEYEFNEALSVDKTFKPARDNIEAIKKY